MKPLTPLMKRCVVGLAELHRPGYGTTHAALAMHMGLEGSERRRGPWSGMQNASQRIIFPMIALERRGLVRMAARQDGLSGTAHALTDEGHGFVARLRLEGVRACGDDG